MLVPTHVHICSPPRLVLKLTPHRGKPWFRYIRWGFVGVCALSIASSVLILEWMAKAVYAWLG